MKPQVALLLPRKPSGELPAAGPASPGEYRVAMRIRSLSLSLLVLIALAGCGSSSDETTTTTAEGATTTTAATATTAGNDVATTTADTTTTTEAVAAGGPSCLSGMWVIESPAFLESLREVFADEAQGGEITEVNGTYTIEMADDGTMIGQRDEWGFTVLTAEGTVDLSMDGTETGTWEATEDTITVEIESSDMNVSVTVEADGQVFTLADSPINVPDVITSATPYSCAGDMLTVTSDGVEFVLARA
jgi:hypothetical protein